MDNHEPLERSPQMTPPSANLEPAEPRDFQPDAPPPEHFGGSRMPVVWFMILALLLAVLVRFNYIQAGTLWTIGIVAVGLGFVIFIHELGHFLVAKWCDVHVETFSIGFGPAIPGCKFQRGETTYMIAWFPLGGYVKMVGEGAENDEDDTDPRSFKNKTVLQRMAIISAGVIMNVILGCVCFVLAYMHGVEQQAAVVGTVDAGSPAWEKGVQAGMLIEQIGDIRKPYYEDLLFTVVLTQKDEEVQIIADIPGKPPLVTHIKPRLNPGDLRPTIGIASDHSLRMITRRDGRDRETPVRYNSAAARAQPEFEFDDVIIGSTDPDQMGGYDPTRVKPLRIDPRDPTGKQCDYFEFMDRLHRLAGEEIVVVVQRKGSQEPVPIRVPRAYQHVLGIRMQMGHVTAVRDGSPAGKARQLPDGPPGVQVRDLSQKIEGDIINAVQVDNPEGGVIRWVVTRSQHPSAGVTEKDLDPVRLPHDLEQWAKTAKEPKKVKLIVLRKVGHQERTPVTLETAWQDGWEMSNAVPVNLSSPMAIPGLGIAYRVQNTVEEVKPSSAAARALLLDDKGEVTETEQPLQKGDVIKGVRFLSIGKPGEKPKPEGWIDLEKYAKETESPGLDQWARIFYGLQMNDIKVMDVRVERDNAKFDVRLTAAPADGKDGRELWVSDDRGLNLVSPDERLQKANGILDALRLGVIKTERFIVQIYQQLRSIVTARVSVKNLGGPIMIATTAYHVADYDFFKFILFLGMISVNLAVINFLPIPVLDGGHMVFLIYEKLRGKPASEHVRVFATYVGLILILSLMGFVIYLDISRMF